MRQNLNCPRVSSFTIAIFLAALLRWAGDPAPAAADVAELLAGQPAESLIAKLQLAEVAAAEGITIERSTQKVEVPGTGSAVVIESNAQPKPGSKLAGELTAAQWRPVDVPRGRRRRRRLRTVETSRGDVVRVHVLARW
ncbi:MAG: hypothetical protein MUE50_26245 [Pirellulaceae bacterium]|nr:hypothetical protein [Pirellulaceae bacterium]